MILPGPLDNYQTLTVEIPKEWWMTSNQRLHRMDKARRTANIRQLAAIKARGLMPVTEQVAARCHIALDSRRHFDPPNAWPTVKAILDGITDARIWPDDDATHVPVTSFLRDWTPAVKGSRRVTIQLIPQPHHASLPF